MTEINKLLQQNLLSVFSERNARKRMNALSTLWQRDGILLAGDGSYSGFEEIGKAAGLLLSRYPEYTFTAVGITNEIPGAGRLCWAFGTPGMPPAATGEDVVVVSSGRITALYQFLTGPAL
jgi:hypothetical protein